MMRFGIPRPLAVGAFVLGAACVQPQPGAGVSAPPPAALAAPALDAAKPAELPGLPNVVAYAPGLYSGGAPEGGRAFDALRSLGVRTIVSVDGAAPDVAAARAHGLRYIHLPIGYNGMDERRALEISKAVRDAGGPVYVHCHHGKHRSAAATGAAAVTLGLLTNEQAERKLKVSGTAPNYKGLYQCVALARPTDRAALDAIPGDFPEVWRTSGLVKSMVEADEALDHLKAIEAAGWAAPRESPDLVPPAEAARLADLLRNLRDDEKVKAKPAEFAASLMEVSAQADALEGDLLHAGTAPAELSAKLGRVAQSCKDCHAKWRD